MVRLNGERKSFDGNSHRLLKRKNCRNPGLNQGPLDLQSNALPTELFRLLTNNVDKNRYSQTSGQAGEGE